MCVGAYILFFFFLFYKFLILLIISMIVHRFLYSCAVARTHKFFCLDTHRIFLSSVFIHQIILYKAGLYFFFMCTKVCVRCVINTCLAVVWGLYVFVFMFVFMFVFVLVLVVVFVFMYVFVIVIVFDKVVASCEIFFFCFIFFFTRLSRRNCLVTCWSRFFFLIVDCVFVAS
jgi:hypothetical protein